LSYRLCLRATMLVARGSAASSVFRRLRVLYARRSRLVHKGDSADFESVTHLQQYLMCAVPSMARLSSLAGGYTSAIQLLDGAAFARDPVLEELFDFAGWWSYVDVPTVLNADPKPRGRFR